MFESVSRLQLWIQVSFSLPLFFTFNLLNIPDSNNNITAVPSFSVILVVCGGHDCFSQVQDKVDELSFLDKRLYDAGVAAYENVR